MTYQRFGAMFEQCNTLFYIAIIYPKRQKSSNCLSLDKSLTYRRTFKPDKWHMLQGWEHVTGNRATNEVDQWSSLSVYPKRM